MKYDAFFELAKSKGIAESQIQISRSGFPFDQTLPSRNR
jgi:hypothetical protein